jgi:hypothetical protein
MKQDPSNPARNCLPKSIAKEDLVAGIETSGYPLQGIVASKLIKTFVVSEEWGYIDRDSKEHRSLDLFAYKSLDAEGTGSVRPDLVLLIECKRSQHPYIFFKNVTERPIPRFPMVAGLIRGVVPIHELSKNRMREVRGAEVLGVDKIPFVEPGPPKCSAFSRGVPSGKKVDLSGSDPFNSVVLPLVKALDHAAELNRVGDRPNTLRPTLMLCVNVIDAPMVLVENPCTASDPILSPWVRIVRQEANTNSDRWVPFKFYAIDAVHIDFFDEFLDKHLLPFATTFADRSRRFGSMFFNGGVVDSLDTMTWDQIRPKG